MPDSPDTFTKLSARRLFYYSKESRIPRLGDVRPPPRSRWEQNQMETFETESSNELSQNEILYRAVALLESIGVAFSEAVKYSYDDSEELKSKQPSIAKKENRPIPPHIKTNFKSEVFLKSSSPTDVLTEGPTLSLNLNRPKLNVTKQPIENKSIQDVSQKTFQPYPQQNQVDTSLNNFGQDLSTADLMATLPPEQFSSAAALALGSTSIDLTSKVMRRLLMVENSGSDISRERFNNTKNGISRAMTLPVMPSIENPTHPVSLTPLKQRMKSPETWTSQTIKSSNQSELNNGSRSRAESTESTHSNKSTIRKVQSRTKPSSPQRSRTVSSPYTSPYLSSSENPHSMPPRKPPIPTFKKADSKASSKPTSPSNDFKNPSLSMKNLENSTQSAEVPFSTSSSSPNTSQKIKSTPKLVSLDQVTTPYFTPRKTTPQSSAHPSPSPSRKNIDEAKTISVPFLSSSSVSPTLLPRKPPIPVFRKRKASSTTTDTMSTDIAPYESALTEVVLLNEPSPAQELLPQENTNKITSHALNRMEVVVADNLLSGHEDVTDAKPSQVSDMEAIEALTSTHSSGLSIPSPISEARSDESDVFSRPVFKPPLAVQNTPLAASVTPLSFSTLNSLRADSYPTSQTTKMLRSPKVSTSRLPSITQLHNEEELENSDGGVKEQDITQSLDRNPRILAKQGSEDSSMSNHGRIYRIGMKIHRSVDIETPSSSSDGSSVFGVFTRSSDLTDGSDDLSLRGPNSTFESETGGLPNQIPLVVTTSYDDDMLLEEIRKSKKESEVDLNVAQIQDTKDTEANDNVVPSNLEATSQLVSEKRKVPTKARSPDLSRRSIAKPGKQSTLRTLVTAASDLVNSAVTDQSKHSESAETEPSNFIAKSVTEEKKIMNDVVQPTLSLQKAANEKTTKSKQFADSLSLALQSIEPVESSTKSEVLSDNTPTITLQRVESNPVPSSNPKSAVSKVKFLSKASSPVELSKMGLHRSGSLGSLQFSQRSSVTKSSRSQSVILGPHPNPFADRSNSLKKPQQIESKTNSDASLISISKEISMAVEGKARNRVEVLEKGGGRDSSGKSQIQPTMTEFRLQSLKVLLSTSQQPSKIPVSKRSSSSDNHKSANEFEYLSTSNSIGLPVSGQTSNALLPSPNSSSAHSTTSRSGIPKRTSLAVINSTGGVSLSNYKPSSSSRLGSLGSSHFLPRRQSAISGIAMGESAYLPIDPSVTGSPTNRHGRSPSGNGRETQFSIRPTVNAQNSVTTKSQNRRLSGVHGTSSSPTPLQFGELVNEHKSRPRGKAVRGPRKFSLEWIKDKFSFSRKTAAM